MTEIHARGPISCGIDANYLDQYTGGIIVNTPGDIIDHIVEVTGWGTEPTTGTKYWWVRNSWGEYWGEMGFARVGFGSLLLEEECAWAVVGNFTTMDIPSKPVYEDGSNAAAENQDCGIWCTATLLESKGQCLCDGSDATSLAWERAGG